MEEELKKLHKNIVATVTEVDRLGLKDENDMVCLFPADWMEYGLGNEIIIEVTLPESPEYGVFVQNMLASNLANAVYGMFPEASVECSVKSVDYLRIGHAERGCVKGSSLTLPKA